MLQIEMVSRSEELKRHQGDWQALAARSPEHDLFQTYEWVSAWLAHFWRGRPISFPLIRRDGTLLAVAPLIPDQRGDLWCSHSLVLPVNEHVTRAGLVHAEGLEDALDALLAYLRGVQRPVRLGLKHLDRSSPVVALLPRIAAHYGLATSIRDSYPSPTVELEGDLDKYLRTRSKHVRSELKRKQKRAREAGLRRVVLTRPEDCDTAMKDILQIEAHSWKDAAGTSFPRERGAEGFYSDLARSCAARGWMRFYILYRDELPVAHLYGMVYGQQYFALKTSYDPAVRDLSPGTVLVAQAIQDACEQGLSAVDLLGIPARWKDELATAHRQQVDACAFSSLSGRCRVCQIHHKHLRPAMVARAKPFVERNAPALLNAKRKVVRWLWGQ